MIQSKHSCSKEIVEDEANFDDLMADLFVIVTHHSLTQCQSVLPRIVDRIHALTHHAEIDCYPKQLQVLLKMQSLWRTRLFKAELSQVRH